LTVILDTNFVVALYDAADPDHGLVADWMATADEDLVATPLV
jgi:predicted nucleic acid-binding protein